MIRGSAFHMAANAFGYLFLLGILISLGLMGEQWGRFFVLASAAVVPFACAVIAIGAWMNRCTPDDEERVFRKPGGMRIPYERIRSLDVMERGRTLDVYAKLGTFRMMTMLRFLPVRERSKVLDELARRLPGVPLRTRSWRRLATAAIVMVTVVAGIAAAHLFLYQRHPALCVMPKTLEGAASAGTTEGPKGSGRSGKRSRGTRARIGEFRFTPPAGFEFLGEGEGRLAFFDNRRQIRIDAVANVKHEELERHAAWFRIVMGVDDYAGLMGLIARARYGLVPLTLRSIALFRLEDVILYESGPPLPRSFITQGKRDKHEHAHLLFPGTHAGSELHLFVSGLQRMTVDELRKLVLAVEITGGGLRTGPADSVARRSLAFHRSRKGG